MAERDGYIPGVPCWVDSSHPDGNAAVAFYRGLFGWEFEDTMPDGEPGDYFIGRIRGLDAAGIGTEPAGGSRPAKWNTYVWVDSADETAATAVEAGGAMLAEPFDVLDLCRVAFLTDPEGAAFCVWQPYSHKGAAVVNEHGAVNFNNLATRDPERAKAFYGAVFGWGVLSLPGGQMWTLPGYGDHLEEGRPGLREQYAQMGAPYGFIDVVAALDPIAADDSDTQPHWSVTFAVDDVEATAATARELGGEVVTGPVDVPWSRMAVIKDPQGAVVIASQFVAENADLDA